MKNGKLHVLNQKEGIQMGRTIGCKTIIYMIVACIAIGFISQAQLSQKNEASPLYEFRAAQAAEEFGLAPSGSANSGLEFGSVTTADLTVQTKQPPPLGGFPTRKTAWFPLCHPRSHVPASGNPLHQCEYGPSPHTSPPHPAQPAQPAHPEPVSGNGITC
jgi:hypothetical protein